MRKLIVLIITSALLAGLFTGCAESGLGDVIKSGGDITTGKRDFADFTRVNVGSAFDVEITRSDTFSVIISGDKSLFDLIEVSKDRNTLNIYLKPRNIFTDFTIGANRMKAEITMPSLRGLELSGASRASVSGFKETGSLSIAVSGASSLKMTDVAVGDADFEVSGASRVSGNLTALDIRFEISGASSIELSGSAEDITLDVSGASRADLGDFQVDNADIELSGAAEATINVGGTLDSVLSDASRLYFFGNPTMGKTDVSGASTIKHK